MNHRYNMTLLAINTNPYFYLSSIEIQREGTTYTIDTIKSLQSKYRNTEFYFIIGSDSFYNIHKWKNYKELLSLCKFIVAKRPDMDDGRLEDRVKEFNKNTKILSIY